MLTPRNLAIVAAAAGAFAGLPLSTAQACDNDRFPCPIVVDSAQEASEAPSRASPAAQPRKKTGQTARQGDKPTAKVEREASEALQAPARPRASKPAVGEQADAPAKASKWWKKTKGEVDRGMSRRAASAIGCHGSSTRSGRCGESASRHRPAGPSVCASPWGVSGNTRSTKQASASCQRPSASSNTIMCQPRWAQRDPRPRRWRSQAPRARCPARMRPWSR